MNRFDKSAANGRGVRNPKLNTGHSSFYRTWTWHEFVSAPAPGMCWPMSICRACGPPQSPEDSNSCQNYCCHGPPTGPAPQWK